MAVWCRVPPGEHAPVGMARAAFTGSVTDWSPLRIGGFTTSIRYVANIAYVNTLSSKVAFETATFAANIAIEERLISGIKNPHFMRVSDFAVWII